MKEEVLNEIDQMKYLFGYKAGKVISEQVKPQQPAQPSEPKPTGGVNIEGTVYKFPGITDKEKLEQFVELGNTAADFGKIFGGVSQGWIDDAIRVGQKNKQLRAQGVTSDKFEQSVLNSLRNATQNVLYYIAEQGITPEKLKDKGIQDTLLSRNNNFLKNALAWEVVDRPGQSPSKENTGAMDIPSFFNQLSVFVANRMKEIK